MQVGVFGKSNQGLLINTLNKELTIIGDTVGHLALIASYFFQLYFIFNNTNDNKL